MAGFAFAFAFAFSGRLQLDQLPIDRRPKNYSEKIHGPRSRQGSFKRDGNSFIVFFYVQMLLWLFLIL